MFKISLKVSLEIESFEKIFIYCNICIRRFYVVDCYVLLEILGVYI